MKRKTRALYVLAGLGLIGGCVPHNHNASDATPVMTGQMRLATETQPQNHSDYEQALITGKHQTAHDGVLNAIVKCEIGHAEVKIEGDTLHVWFVGGAPDTTRAVRIPDRAVTLEVVAPTTRRAKILILKPEPLDLAGETIGNCSRFEGAAPWLQGLTRFTATASVNFKGQKRPLRIEYPDGYDPD